MFGIICGGLAGNPVGTALVRSHDLAPGLRSARELKKEMEFPEDYPTRELVVEVEREDTGVMRNLAILALAMGLYSSFTQAATFAAIARLVVFASTCAALIALRRTGGPAPAFQLPGGTVIAVGGLAFSLWLISTRRSTELWILLGIILVGAVLIRTARVRMAARRSISAPRPY